MGTVSDVTSQLNAIGGCTPARDCCSDVDAMKGELAALKARVAALEGKSGDANEALKQALLAVGLAREAGASASSSLVKSADATKTAASALAGAGDALSKARGVEAGLWSLRGLVAPLIAAAPLILLAAGTIGAIGLEIAALKYLANSAYDLASTAMSIAGSAADQAATAILRNKETDAKADRALGAAQNADNNASRAGGVANSAEATANRAAGESGEAISNAVRAISVANGASAAANIASTIAGAAQATADRALGTAGAAQATADRALGTAGAAQATADRALGTAGTAQATADRALGTAGAAQATADRALGTAGAAQATAGAAQTTADRALATALANANKPGTPGRQGEPGQQGKQGEPGKDGKPGKDGATDTALPQRVTSLESRFEWLNNYRNTVNQSDKDEIVQKVLQGTNFQQKAIPAVLVASQVFQAAAVSAAATGSCQSSRPGGCSGGTPDQIKGLGGDIKGLGKDIQGWIGAGFSALNNNGITQLKTSLQNVANTANTINRNVGQPVVGTLSTWAAATSEVVNRSQILNILTYISVLHNAYFLSNSLAQTLFSTVSNSLAAMGIKDTSKDPNGTPFDIGKIVGDWTEGFFKSVFGVATVEGMKADWKRHSRTYQAAAQVMYSAQSIGHSVLGALEVVGSRVSKIGNALQKFRTVGENAYGWMNPQTSFQNRFFTGLQATQETVSTVSQVSSEVLSAQEAIAQFQKQKDDLVKSAGEDPDGKKADETPEAVQIKAAAEAAKVVSKTPDIPESAQIKP